MATTDNLFSFGGGGTGGNIFELGGGSREEDKRRTFTLGGMTPEESGLFGAGLAGGGGQIGLLGSLLGKEAARLGGVPGAPAPGTTGFRGIAGPAAYSVLGSPELAQRLAGVPSADVLGSAYQGLLGRAGGPEEIAAWQAQGLDPQVMLARFLQSPEAQARLGGMTSEQGLQALYSGLLGRAASPGELAAQYTGLGLPAEGAGGIPGDPEAEMLRRLTATAGQSLLGRLGPGGGVISPEMRAKIGEAFQYQRGRGMEDLTRRFREEGARRGLDPFTDTPVARMRGEAEADFLANLASQQAGAEIGAGQQEMQNLQNLLYQQGGLAQNAERNRLGLLTAVPGLAALLIPEIQRGRLAAGAERTKGTTGETRMGGGLPASTANFLLGQAAGPAGTGVSALGDLFKGWFGGGGGSTGQTYYDPSYTGDWGRGQDTYTEPSSGYEY